jgi:hypothetical protein
MATRTRTSFQKRQKELARVEKQRDKAAKRLQRKLEGPKPEETDDMLMGAGVAEDGEGEAHDETSIQGDVSTQQEESH